jgi:hypothetical protein
MLGHSIVSQHFMEPEGSIPNSQEISTCSYPEPPSHLSKIHLNIIHPPTSWSSSGLFPSGFPPNNLYAFLFSPIRATWPTDLILLDLIILIILGEEYRSQSSSLYNFLHSPLTSSLFSHCWDVEENSRLFYAVARIWRKPQDVIPFLG